jgi:plastocyanin
MIHAMRLAACVVGASVVLLSGAVAQEPAPAPATATKATAARLEGRVPVLSRKTPAAIKDYGPPPAFKVEPPEAPASAVWVGSGAPALDPAKTEPIRIEQRGFQFRPALAVVQVGTPIVFPNQDSLYHSVFSYSPTKRFDLGRFRKGEEPDPVVMDKPGAVQLFCEVHEHMRANLLVVDTPWHAVTDGDGRFSIDGIAPGTHVVRVWLSPKQTVERTVELKAGQSLEVDWSDLVPAAGKDAGAGPRADSGKDAAK